MLIRAGHRITLECPQPTAINALLNVHPDRAADLRTPDTTRVTPPVAIRKVRDAFGNDMVRVLAPAGDQLALRVTNPGPGIPPEVQAHLF